MSRPESTPQRRPAPRRSTRGRLRLVVSGMVAAVPHQGGATWAVLQYVLGLRKLGHEVHLIEPIDPAAVRPPGARLEASINATYFHEVMEAFGLESISALLLAGTRQTFGLTYPELRRVAARADLLLNISGMLAEEALLEPIPRRVYLDLDPGFNQLWSAAEGIDMRFDAHSDFVTVGLSLGSPQSTVPTCGREWIATTQPVVLDHWAPSDAVERDAFTTVANWRGYGSIEHGGVHYGQKAHSLRQFMDLPTRTAERLQLALAIHPDERADRMALAANGWELLDPARVASTPDGFQRFVRGSKAELGIAKSGYVAANCGWFSDRSACYLASGRPVLAQETGFSRHLPTGDGLLAFATTEEALDGIDSIRSDYPRHARAAREIAQEYFDSDTILRHLLSRLEVDS